MKKVIQTDKRSSMKIIVASSIEIQIRNIFSCKMWNSLAFSMLLLLQTMNVCCVALTEGDGQTALGQTELEG